MADSTDDDNLTTSAVAKILRVSDATVRRWDTNNVLKPARKLPGSKHRRYRRSDVEEFRDRLERGEIDQ